MNDKELIKLAIEASEKAYIPYSGCSVGAALLTKDGKVYQGCNIENAAFSPTICAERVAFSKAVFEGERQFEKIAIFGKTPNGVKDYFYPCGVCRQVMAEFCDEDFMLIIAKSEDDYLSKSLKEVLPFMFSPQHLE